MWCPLCQNDPCDVLPLDLLDIARNPVWLFSDEAEQLLGSGQCYLAYAHALALFPDLSDHEEIEQPSMETGDCDKPSQVTEVYWLWARRQRGTYPASSEDKVGKWFVFVPASQVDAAWAIIRRAVENGLLGDTAKVATARPSPLAQSGGEHVICVYTYDWTDEYDVRRIHAALCGLGFTWPMSYKTDADTLAGKYAKRGHTRIGKYRLDATDAQTFKAGRYNMLQRKDNGEQQGKLPALRLQIELVPEPCWYSNMRKAMPPAAWDKLRKQVYAQYGYRCGICGASARLHCHEIWQYDDKEHIQTLQGFIALCEWCHHVKHLGLAGILAREGKLDYDRVIAHFLTVNECSWEDFELHRRQAFDQWRERNNYQWRTDLGKDAHLVSANQSKAH